MMGELQLERSKEISERLDAIARRLKWLTFTCIVLALFVALCTIFSFTNLANFWAYDALFEGAALLLVAILGFAAGWVARRRA